MKKDKKITYASNLFRSASNIDYTSFPCFTIDLSVSEAHVWNTLKENRVFAPHYVAEGSLYFTDENIAELDFLSTLMTGTVKETTISNSNPTGARVIGGMLYRGLANYLMSLGFKTIGGIAGGSVYFIPKDPMYVKEIQGSKDEGFYLVFRGFGPKIHSGSVPGSVFMLLETRSKFRVNVPQERWPQWVGCTVARRGKAETKGFALLKEVDEKKKVGILKRGDLEFEVSLDDIYVPAASMTLARHGVYEVMLEFAQFRDESDKAIESSFMFLSKVFGKVLEGDSIKFKMDAEGKMMLEYRKIEFELEGA